MYEEWINKKETVSDVISDSLISKFKTCLTAEIDMSYLCLLYTSPSPRD